MSLNLRLDISGKHSVVALCIANEDRKIIGLLI